MAKWVDETREQQMATKLTEEGIGENEREKAGGEMHKSFESSSPEGKEDKESKEREDQGEKHRIEEEKSLCKQDIEAQQKAEREAEEKLAMYYLNNNSR